jgi:hypothetical protein
VDLNHIPMSHQDARKVKRLLAQAPAPPVVVPLAYVDIPSVYGDPMSVWRPYA